MGSSVTASSTSARTVFLQGWIDDTSDGWLAYGDIDKDTSMIQSGTLPIARGGTNSTTAAVAGGAVYSTASAMAITAAGTSGQILRSNGASAPTWATAYYSYSTTAPSSPTIGQTYYETDTGELLVYYGATTGWRRPWNMPWGFVQYAQTTSNVSVKNGNILTSTISVFKDRRYRIHGHVQAFYSTVINDVAGLAIVDGGNAIQSTNVTATIASYAGFGVEVVGHYTATATNTGLSCNLYNIAVVGAGTHTFQAAATYPIFIAVEDIGPASTPPTV